MNEAFRGVDSWRRGLVLHLRVAQCCGVWYWWLLPPHPIALYVCVCVCGASKIPFGLQQSPLIMSVKMQLRLFLSTPGDTPSPSALRRSWGHPQGLHSSTVATCTCIMKRRPKKSSSKATVECARLPYTRYPTDQQDLLNMLHTSRSGLEISNS